MKYLLLFTLLLSGCDSFRASEPELQERRNKAAQHLKEIIYRIEYEDATCFVYEFYSVSCIPKNQKK